MTRRCIALGLSLYVAMIILGILLRWTSLWSLNVILTSAITSHISGSVARFLASGISLTASVFAVWIIILSIIVYTYIKGGSMNLKSMVTLSLLTLMLTEISVALSKYHFSILRPGLNTTVTYVGSEVLNIYSYPSGHSARSTVMAYWLPSIISSIISVSERTRKIIALMLWLWVAVISLCRVIAQEHYLLDVIGGVLTGLGSTFLMRPLLPIIKERIS